MTEIGSVWHLLAKNLQHSTFHLYGLGPNLVSAIRYLSYGGKVAPKPSQLSAMSRLFSSSVFREMATKGRSPLFSRLMRLTEVNEKCGVEPTVGDAFDAAFSILKAMGRRDEYIYRAALTRRVLMGKHSLKTACMLTEFRAGACKADLVILNGTATVYEIKSERDSLVRLSNQVENYQKVFAKTYVIASEDHVDSVLKIVPRDIGVLKLSMRYQISTVREADDRPDRICPTTVCESLRHAEACEILASLGIEIPDVPNTQRHEAMRACFERLNPIDVHMAMVATLKRSRNLAPLTDFVGRLPQSLHAAALSIDVRRADQDRIIDAVSAPLSVAMTWA
jgi:hypothetical protein